MNYVINIDISKFTDPRNIEIVKQVSSFAVIRLSEIQHIPAGQDPRIWKCIPQGDEWNISYYIGYPVIEYFTHEILHAYLICNGFIDSKYLNANYDLSNNVVDYIFEKNNLTARINNIFAHEKMFPIFKEKKFTESLFTSDYSDRPNFQLEFINEEFNEKGLPNQSIAQYIYSYFHAIDVRNPAFMPSALEHLSYLKNLNSELYLILNDSWSLWQSTNYLSLNRPILEILVGKVIEWYNVYSK